VLHIFPENKILLRTLNPAETKEHVCGGLTGRHYFVPYRGLDFKPDVDLFASRINHQSPHCVFYRPGPEAIAIDAFSLNWSNLNFYAFPPFSVIPTVLNKLMTEGTQGICVLLDWPTQLWYPKWNQYCRDKNIDVFQPGVTNGFEFIVYLYKTGLGYSAINMARSALSSILVLEDGVTFQGSTRY